MRFVSSRHITSLMMIAIICVALLHMAVAAADVSDVDLLREPAEQLGSECSISAGCPRSSMAWASGSFTEDGVLTPQALALDTQLTLQISLCCGYLFHGGMLHNSAQGEEMYDVFLETLLHATPLRIFSLDEKRKLFPRNAAVIGSTATGKRYSTTMLADEDELSFGNDGDGDVLILTTGAIDAAAYRIPFKSITASNSGGAAARGSVAQPGEKNVDEDDEEEAYDVQLLLSNRVLKCKCPHTLHIMPMLFLKRDRVPALRLHGGGARCITSSDVLVVAPSSSSQAAPEESLRGNTEHPSAVDGLVVMHTFRSEVQIPKFSHVVWEVHNTHPLWNGPRHHQAKHGNAASGQVVADPLSSVNPVLVHRRWATVGLPRTSASYVAQDVESLSGLDALTTLSDDGMTFTFPAHLHTRYRVTLRVVKGPANGEASGRIVLRAQVLEHWKTVEFPLQPFVGYRYSATVRSAAAAAAAVETAHPNRPQDVQLLRDIVFSSFSFDDGDYHTRWSSVAAAGPKASPGAPHVIVIPSKANTSTPVPIYRGHSVVSFIIVDSDEACPPVTVEQHHVFGIQLMITTPPTTPFTACANETKMEARDERAMILSDLRRQLLAAQAAATPTIAVGTAAYAQLWFRGVDVVAEQWHCSSVPQVTAATLTAAPDLEIAAADITAQSCTMLPSTDVRTVSLSTREPVVAAVQWRMRLKLLRRTNSLALDANLTREMESQLFESAWFGGVVTATAEEVVMDAFSPPVLIYRRTAALPAEVDVYLPMHATQYDVSAPNTQVRGRWVARNPLAILSAPNAASVTLGTSRVPNAVQVLSRGTLQFVVSDAGELVSIPRALFGWLVTQRRAPRQTTVTLSREALPPSSAAVGSTADDEEATAAHRSNTLSFVARCPDAAVEYNVHVVAFPPVAVSPAHELVVTEDATVTLTAPRPAAKGEEISWTVENCTDDAIPTGMAFSHGDSIGAVLVGVQPHMHCEVRWTSFNPAGITYKVFSIRRCEAPPPLKFSNIDGKPLTPVLRRRDSDTLQIQYGEAPMIAPNVVADTTTVLVLPFAGAIVTTVVSYVTESDRSRFSTEWAVTDSWHVGRFLHRQFVSSANSSEYEALWAAMEWNLPSTMSVVATATTNSEDPNAKKLHEGTEALLRFNASGVLARVEFVESVAPKWMAEPKYAADATTLFPAYGMCPPRHGHIFSLHVTPLDVVRPVSFDNDTGLPVIEMCSDTMLLARHPSLHNVYGYSWDWQCSGSLADVDGVAVLTPLAASLSPIVAERVPDRHLQHLFLRSRNAGTDEHEPRAYCKMLLHNTFTKTDASAVFLVKGVKPSVFTAAHVKANITSVNRLVVVAAAPQQQAAPARGGRPVAVLSPLRQQQQPAYNMAPGMLSFVGPAAMLHLSPPASSEVPIDVIADQQALVRWAAVAVTPQYKSSSEYRGTSLILSNITFEDKPNTAHIATKYGEGGVTVWMEGFGLPGVYTIQYHQHDPLHPLSCPPVSLSQLLHVYRAQVVVDTIVVCTAESEVRAIPLPRELARDFYGQWEIVGREDDLSIAAGVGMLTSGQDLVGMRFDHTARPETRVTGLPFGIVTLRWAIYKNIKEADEAATIPPNNNERQGSGNSNTILRRVLVDEARVTIFVLTENLRANRVVTLADTVDVAVTSSTYEWRFAETGTLQGPPNAGGLLAARSSTITFRFLNRSSDTTPLGASIMNVRNLRVGVTRLYYETRPSLRIALMEKLRNLTCPVAPATSLFEVERVTAFLSLHNVSGDHECDAYFNNRVNFSLCLEAGDRTTAQFFNERVALVDAARMERIIKDDASTFAGAVGCSVPWWASEETAEWTSTYAFEDQRCFFFAARAKRHLTPREAAHPLLEAAALPRGGSLAADSISFAPCAGGADIFSVRLLEGVDVVGSPSAGGQGMKPFLSILEPSSLRPPTARLHAALRPLIGFDARDDDVATETQLATERPVPATVTLQLDHTHAALPYTAVTPSYGNDHGAPGATLLDKCLDNTLTVNDVVALWSPTESSSANVLVQHRWAEYVAQAGNKYLLGCEPMWPSLEHMLPRAHDTLETLATRRAQVFSPSRQLLVPLSVIEEQLSALNRSHYWTRDGIEVTGLSPELANALLRKKVTAQQFEDIQKHREALHQQQLQHAAHHHDAIGDEPFVFSSDEATVAGGGHAVIPAEQRRVRFEAVIAEYSQWKARHQPAAAAGIQTRNSTVGQYRTDSIIAALRLVLPAAPRFTAPEHFAVRMSLSKDTVCGSRILTTPLLTASHVPPATAVDFQRLVIRDEPPVVSVSPLRVKQCDVEGALPTITIRLDNIAFADNVANFTFADWRSRVELTELENPNVTALLALEGNRHAYSDNIVGLKPCLGNMLRGARVMLDTHTSQKVLQLQFAPCPHFLMLSNEEYNERQEGDILLARLQHPRYFMVVLRNVVGRDSYTHSVRVQPAAVFVNAETISFTVTVSPTLVRLHLRRGGHHLRGEEFVIFHDTPSLPSGGSTAPTPSPVISGAAMICESAMKQEGFELGFELVGDNWHYAVGRSFISIGNNNGDTTTPALHPQDEDYEQAKHVLSPSRRTQQDVSLLNAFSLVEHHILDAATYAFLYIGGGLYRSHFVHYLFSSVLRDAVGSMSDAQRRSLVQSNLRDGASDDGINDNSYAARQKFVHRYNDTFIGLRFPSASSNSDANQHRHISQQRLLPPSLPFNTIEEILFAVPGITTKCKGCLLADRTFFVAGDGSGVFSVGTTTSGGGSAVKLAARKISAPFEIPFDGLLQVPRTIVYEWLCTFSASSLAQQVLRKFTPSTRPLQPLLSTAFFVTEVYVLSPRDELGRTLPLAAQAKKLISTLPVPADAGDSALRFSFSEEALETAVTLLAMDYTGKFLKPHLKPTFDYTILPSGAVAVNATTTLSLCIIHATSPDGLDCTVVYYKPSLLLVDRRGQLASSVISFAWLQPAVLLHNVMTIGVFYWSLSEQRNSAPLFPVALLAAALFVFSATLPVIAIGMWLLVWADVFRHQGGLWPVFAFGVHGLVYAYGATRRV